MFRVIIAAVLASFAFPAFADAPAGSAVGVNPQATAQLGSSTITLSPGALLYMGQKVTTGPNGQVQVVFSDDTHLVIGPGSSLLISEYLLRNGGDTASKFVVNALAGTYRFVTGNSPKDAYEIQTPTGTIGVRGTAFDFNIDPVTHQTHVLLYHGGVTMCSTSGGCVFMSSHCGVGVIPQNQGAAVLGSNDKSLSSIVKSFPYANSEKPLKTDFQVGPGNGCGGVHVSAPIAPAVSGGSGAMPPPPPPPPPPCVPPPCVPPPCWHPSVHFSHNH